MAKKATTKTKAPAAPKQPEAPKAETRRDENLVVIPYLAKEAQGRELEYAVAGWRKHFKENYRIVVVGDHHPVVDKGDDITFIKCPRVPQIPGQYQCHIDHVHKFREVRKHFPESKGFIYACDDMYAVNDFTMVEVLLPKKDREMSGDLNHINPWNRDQAKTRKLCEKNNLPVVNYVCHLPVYYEWDKLFAIYDKYDCDHNSYVVENLYFNTYFANRVPAQLSLDHDNLKCGIYRPNPRLEVIRKAFHTKIWISNGVSGWIPQVDDMLRAYYGLK